MFVAPLTSFLGPCVPACNTNPVLLRGEAELRLITPYADYKRSLVWLGVGAGLAYVADVSMRPGPDLSLAVGGDLRLGPSLWFELSPRVNWEFLPGPATTLAGNYFTIGIDLGLRVDLAH
jgi:hypothetical protein